MSFTRGFISSRRHATVPCCHGESKTIISADPGQVLSGAGPLEFLTELRLELARRKLKTTDLGLADIAAEAGYQSESSFSRAFKRRFGHPPGALRAGQT